jgi:nitrate reductase gamma subunit
MPNTSSYFDALFFVVLPYVAFFTFFLVTIQRYRQRTFSYSSLSSQFLENKRHFWSLVPFHYGILVVLTGHIVAFLFPRELLLFDSRPIRLYILEVSALMFGLMTLIGLVASIARRASEWTANEKSRRAAHQDRGESGASVDSGRAVRGRPGVDPWLV